MKLGLGDPRPGAIKLQLRDYLNYRLLPAPPQEFGHYQLIPPNTWGDLGNLTYGDCGFAGPAHAIMCWNKVAGRDVMFTNDAVLQNYSAVTGFSLTDPAGQPWPSDPATGEADNPTDRGVDLQQMAAYWRGHGMIDADGAAHQIEAYIALEAGHLQQLWLATWLFESVQMGFALPYTAMEQTDNKQIWDVVPGAGIAGGHCVPNFGRAGALGVGNSWGLIQPFTTAFYETYNNQGLCALSAEMMVKAISVEGFDDAQLRDDLTQLTRV